MSAGKDWREVDPEWQQIWSARRPPDPTPVAPEINFCPRHVLALATPGQKHLAADMVATRISQKRLDFRPGDATLSAATSKVLESIVECLFEYPELGVTVRACCGKDDGTDAASMERLGKLRAEACRDKLVELGAPLVLNTQWRGLDELFHYGCAHVVPSKVKLVDDPQERVALILENHTFGFEAGSDALNRKGLIVADMCARALKEVTEHIMIMVPKESSRLAVKRAEAIKQRLRKLGVTANILVHRAEGDQNRSCVVVVSEPPPQLPHYQDLLELVLTRTPIVFIMDHSDIVPDCRPIVTRCAAILLDAEKDFVRPYCRVEVFAGGNSKGQGDSKLAMKRAEHLADLLRAEGAELELFCYGHDDAPQSATASTHPTVKFTLVDGDSEVFPLEPVQLLELQNFEESGANLCSGVVRRGPANCFANGIRCN